MEPLINKGVQEIYVSIVSEGVTLVSVNMAEKLDYNEAELIIPANNSKSDRWHIRFWVWDALKGKKVRKRIVSINNIKNLNERRKVADRKVKEINRLLATGYHINSEKVKKNDTKEDSVLEKFTIGKAIDLFLESKSNTRPTTIKSYRTKLSTFKRHLANSYNLSCHPNELDAAFFKRYLRRLEKEYSNRTVNNYRDTISSVYNYLINELELDIDSPFKKIPKLRNTIGRNLAFSINQQKELLNYMEKWPWLKTLCQFMYFTLARTNELSHLKFKNIGFYREDKIYLPKEFSKNGIERHITIPNGLRKVMDKMKFEDFPDNWYIFSKNGMPGVEQYNSANLGKIFSRRVLRELKYPKDYTLYSWKHTGVVTLYNAGIPKGDIIRQAGWTNSTSFESYIKSLGLEENENIRTLFPELPS